MLSRVFGSNVASSSAPITCTLTPIWPALPRQMDLPPPEQRVSGYDQQSEQARRAAPSTQLVFQNRSQKILARTTWEHLEAPACVRARDSKHLQIIQGFP